jgi:hypothetical protein
MVVLDIRNSRKKNFYDIWFMANTWTFDLAPSRTAILASFERRKVAIPKDVPFALTVEFLGDAQKKKQWNAFVSRLYPGSKAPSLEEVGALLRAFILPCINAAVQPDTAASRWTPGPRWDEVKLSPIEQSNAAIFSA